MPPENVHNRRGEQSQWHETVMDAEKDICFSYYAKMMVCDTLNLLAVQDVALCICNFRNSAP